jgi:SAM-dependent methyltransferase
MGARAESGELEYLLFQTLNQGTRLARAEVRRLVRGRPDRIPSVVRENYDRHRSGRTVIDFDQHVFGDTEELGHVLIDDRIVWANVSPLRRRLRARVAAAVEAYTHSLAEPTVIEFGCGGGRNLLHLKRAMPHLRCVGIDISPASIDLARRAAACFESDVHFEVADATALDGNIGPGDVCLSVHALEQMPRLFPAAVDSMLACSRRATLFFEPVGEFYPASPRGLLARARLREHDYLDGLYDYLCERQAPVVKAQRLRFAENPLNETIEIHVDHLAKCGTGNGKGAKRQSPSIRRSGRGASGKS